ncbi:hypothetical protein TNCV_4573171 [Trichonephila clavipes]|nr:hypothetical protein TNCV_4573171 [Trichonephila clavipes]
MHRHGLQLNNWDQVTNDAGEGNQNHQEAAFWGARIWSSLGCDSRLPVTKVKLNYHWLGYEISRVQDFVLIESRFLRY